jgi:hypothetical protein
MSRSTHLHSRTLRKEITMGQMLNALHDIEQRLPALLRDRDGWKGVDITYHPPRVERLWRQEGSLRVSLHRIHPCRAEEALLHPHPWPQAIKVLSGMYEMGVGSSPSLETPPIVCRLLSSGPLEYEMEHPDGWHYVRPIDEPSLSIMVTGVPWKREVIKSSHPLRELDESQRNSLFALFSEWYS